MSRAPNPGRCPSECEIRDDAGELVGFRRVHVTFFNGRTSREKSPQGYPSGGRDACNWRIGKPPHPYDIQYFEVI